MEVLERVLNEIDEKLDGQHPSKIFKRILKQVSRNADTMRQLHEENSKEGYVRVRKVFLFFIFLYFIFLGCNYTDPHDFCRSRTFNG